MVVGLLTGNFRATLDEKSRISLPSLLRRNLNETSVWITEGEENCLRLYPSASWNEMLNDIMENTETLSAKDRRVRRQLIGSSQEVEIDKAGRIPIPQNYREHAKLSRDCMVLGQVDYIEIWDEPLYKAYKTSGVDEYTAASEELSSRMREKKGARE